MFETLIFIVAIWLLVEGLKHDAGIFYAISSVLFFVSATSSIQHKVEHLVVNGSVQAISQTVFNYPILYASWGFAILSLGLLIINLFRR